MVVFAGRYFLPQWRSAFEIEYTAICMGLDLAHQYLLPPQQPHAHDPHDPELERRPIVLELQLDHAVIRQQLQGTLPISKTNHQERLTYLYWQIMAQSQAFVFDIEPITPVQNRQAVHLAWTAFVTGQSASVSLSSTNHGSSSSSLSSSIWAIQQRPSQRFVVRQPLLQGHPNHQHPCDLELAFFPLEDPYNRLKKHNEEDDEEEQEENVEHEEEYPQLLDHSLEQTVTEQDANHADSPGNQNPDAPCSSSLPPPSFMVPPRVASRYNERNRMMIPMDPTQTYLLQCDGGCRGRPTFVSGVGMVLYQLDHQDDDDNDIDNKNNHHQDSWHQKPGMENEWNTHLVEVWCGFKCFLPNSTALQAFSSSRHRRNRHAKNETNNHQSSPPQSNDNDDKYDEGLRNEAGRMSNNVAEIWSLILGLEQARRLGIRNLRVQMDCDTVVRIIYQATTTTNKTSSPVPTTDNSNDDDSLSLSSSLSVNALPLGPFIRQVQELVETHFDEFEIEHIRRQYNRRADFLANHAMDFQCDYGVDPDIVISGSSPQHASIPKTQQTELEYTLPNMYKEECDSEDNDDDVNDHHLSSMADQHS